MKTLFSLQQQLTASKHRIATTALLWTLLSTLPHPTHAAIAASTTTLPTAAAATTKLQQHTVTASAAAPRWCAPLGAPLRVTRGFEKPPHRYGPGHRGVDLAGGSAVYAPAAGTVSFSGEVAGRPVLTVRVDDSLVYAIEPIVTALREGDTVAKCEKLGTALGHTPEASIHLGVRVMGEYVNPLPLLAVKPRLLPLTPADALV